MTTFIKEKLQKSDGQTNIDKYKILHQNLRNRILNTEILALLIAFN